MRSTVTVAGSETAVAGGAVQDVRVYRHIDDVDGSVWDSVVEEDDIQSSHRFVRVCERARVANAEYRFVVIRDAVGVACVAALSSFVVPLDLLTSGIARTTVGRIRQWRDEFLRVRVLFCGLPVSFGRPCLAFRRDADRRSCIEALDDVVLRTTRELNAPLVCWKEFDRVEAEDVDPLLGHGYLRVPSLPSCRLLLEWSSFEEYLRAMRSGYRHQVRHAQLLARRAGLTFRTVTDFGPRCGDLHGLYGQVMDRADFQLERLDRAFFEELNRSFPTDSRAILAEQAGSLAACAIVLDAPRVCTFLLAGIDYRRHRAGGAYVNLVTEVVAYAIGRGATALEMGQTSYDIKRRLGAQTTPRYLYVRDQSRVRQALLRGVRRVVFPGRTYPARHVFRRVVADA